MEERRTDDQVRRIAVVGTAGSGKSALASHLAERLEVPHIELDAVFWGPEWTPTPIEVFRSHVEKAVSGEAWIADGNYGKVRDIVWRRAESVVWLDYALPVVMGRVINRTLRRALTREELWNGNREGLFKSFFHRDSIVLWSLSTYGRRRRELPALFRQPGYAHLEVVRLSSPRAAREWLHTL
jgi:adenylate kinase family enzyme